MGFFSSIFFNNPPCSGTYLAPIIDSSLNVRKGSRMGRRRERGVRGKPWYRAARDQWYITINRKKEPLFDSKGNPIRGRDNRSAAEQAWHELATMAAGPDNGADNEADNEVRTILDLYLQDMERRQVTKKSLDTYTAYFKSFVTRYPKLLIRDLRPAHVYNWWDVSHPKWGGSTRNLSGAAL